MDHLGHEKSITRQVFYWLQRYGLFGNFFWNAKKWQIGKKPWQICNILFLLSKCFYLFANYINNSVQSWIWHWPHSKNITLTSNECYLCLLIISDNNLSINFWGSVAYNRISVPQINTVSMLLVFIFTITNIINWVINTYKWKICLIWCL